MKRTVTKGYRVVVPEPGKRWDDEDMPKCQTDVDQAKAHTRGVT